MDPLGFSANPDPAFNLNVDTDPEGLNNADPCGSGCRSWSDLYVTKSSIFKLKIYFM